LTVNIVPKNLCEAEFTNSERTSHSLFFETHTHRISPALPFLRCNRSWNEKEYEEYNPR